MKPITIEMKDLSESTVIYEKKPNPAIVGFIYILLGIIVISVAWMALSEIDIVSEADGSVSYTDDVTMVTCAYSAKITKCNVKDGEYITEGTVLYEAKAQGSDKDPKAEDTLDGKLVIRAEKSGYFYTALERETGSILESGNLVGYIFPNPQKTYQALFYATGSDIGKVREGQQVRIEFPVFPSSEYGTITGTVRKISDEVQYDPQSGTSYCAVWVDFNATGLTDGDNREAPLKNGLNCRARIITDRKKVLTYVWEIIR